MSMSAHKACIPCLVWYAERVRTNLFQRINEHKHSVIGKHLQDIHNLKNKDLRNQFTIFKKCCLKLDCLIYEMLFIKNKKPTLNTQSDSVKAKLFIWQFKCTMLGIFIFIHRLFLSLNHMHWDLHTYIHYITNSHNVSYLNLRMMAWSRWNVVL